jgi:uncharacterized Fe-S center protein
MRNHVQRRDERGEHMTFVSMQHMPLSNAYLCEDCHCVGNCAEQCPACASEALMGLASVLNREQPVEKVQVSFARTTRSNRKGASLAA